MEILALCFLFVFSAVLLASYFLVSRMEPAGETARPGAGATGETKSVRAVLLDLLRSLGESMPTVQKGTSNMRNLLASAGYRAPSALTTFNGVSYAVAALLALSIGAYVLLGGGDPFAALLGGVCGAGFGMLVPKRVLRFLARARGERLVHALPTALDLMVLAVEAGQGLDAAVLETAQELRGPFPDLADEFYVMYLALKAGGTRAVAFRELGERNHDQLELRKLSGVLVEADRFGSSLGPTLRTHARYLRIRRRQSAQEEARKITVKLVFPVFFLIFPSVVLVTLGPAVIQIMKTLRPMMEGR